MSKPRLEGKVALITGAASGIGEATVRLFIEHGAAVVVVDIQDELAHQVIASINSEKVSYYHCDVRDEEQVAAAVNYAIEKYGSLDILFSNAAILGPMTSVLDLDMERFDDVMATNVRGVAATIKHASRAMVERKIKGSIICTASVAASLGGAGPQAYSASKHAVVGLVQVACGELGKHGIRVNCVSPSGLATRMTCESFGLKQSEFEAHSGMAANLKGVVLTTKHVAEAALFLASDESAYVSGLNLNVDGGFTVVSHTFKEWN
ncbi:Reductase [Handroanthus impetiginosus]|uniref:Reductase n=1 Tax=Handroanthus impetiginosus TaxID=429701 RepID=A0A2G9I480_9LAMI|nr:Reductase [Handroanthus impetiginosus]